jgi:hypothetical protein
MYKDKIEHINKKLGKHYNQCKEVAESRKKKVEITDREKQSIV